MHYFNRTSTIASAIFISVFFMGIFALLTTSCVAQPPMDEDAALKNLRDMTSNGRLPAESVVADIENRFVGRKTGALARLLRARIKMESGDPNGAAELLKSSVFEQRTTVFDYVLWLRGKALNAAGNPDAANSSFEELATKFPESIRSREARLLWAENALKGGRADEVVKILEPLSVKNDGQALLLTSRAFDAKGDIGQTKSYLRRAYFFSAGSDASNNAEQRLIELQENLEPNNQQEITARGNLLFKKGLYKDASDAFEKFASSFPGEMDSQLQLKRLTAYTRTRQMGPAEFVFSKIANSAAEKEEAFFEIATGYARSGAWPETQSAINKMREAFPKSKWTPKAMVDAASFAGTQKRLSEKNYYLKLTLALYPDAIEIAAAQFELAWNQHELKNFAESSEMLTEHLARYVDEDNSFRGQSGYWAARDSEKAGKIDAACALYDGTIYRYGANWYGYLALDRLLSLRRDGKCQGESKFPADSMVPKAVENLKVVTVAAETATARELKRAEKSEELGTIGLFDWAINELEEAKKTADNSPKINLALAKHYRLKGDNVMALRALQPSYPDYSQMFPEEMSREEWEIFYPLSHWNDIKYWAGKRSLDPYNVAGLIRQETIFNPNARSGANAYGLMQLLIPTAKSMARKYNSGTQSISGSTLFDASLNIELGTAYMREQLSKYGRIEYMSVAYNAGPGRVVSWRNTLPAEMDEFVEEIPFSETRGYVKGVIRNSAQYRRLYTEAGGFKANVGTKPLRGKIDQMGADTFAAMNPQIMVEKKKTRGK